MNFRKIFCAIRCIAITFVLCTAVLVVLWYTALNPHRGIVQKFEDALPLNAELTPEEALKDIDFLYNTLKGRHPAWLEDSNEIVAQINSMYKKERASIESLKAPDSSKSTITVLELWRIYSRMLALLHDGHTHVGWPNSDQHFINDFTQAMTLGKPVAVDGIPSETLFSSFMEMSSWETEEGAEQTFFGSYYVSDHYLQLCGIDTSDGVTITWNVNGEPKDFHYNFVNVNDIVYPDKATIQAAQTEENTPQSEQKAIPGNYLKYREMCRNATDYVWYYIDKEYNLAVLSLAECNYEDHYCEVVNNFFGEVFSANITNIVVDLRGNGGGSSTVADEFLRHIDVDTYKGWDSSVRYGPILWKNKDIVRKNKKYPEVFSGNLYILTNINTYSSAMDFAMLVTDNNLGKIVGKASGNKPESYGDRLDFQLPVTKLGFSVSFKKWYRVDKSKGDRLIEPDYPCNPSDALQTVYALISKE